MGALARFRADRFTQLIRFYQAALVNTAFGFGIYALLVWLGVNLYLAQIAAQVLGVTFNYFTYSRHVFRDRRGGRLPFIGAYLTNYLVNLGLLAVFDRVTTNDYLAGAAATLCASLVNYLALKHVVFRKRAA